MASQYLLGEPHPAFAEHFVDRLYDDASNEFAPFGTDEGADILADWTAKRGDLTATATVRDLLSDDVDDVDQFVNEEVPNSAPDLDGVIIGTGFTLIRLTGQIDAEGREWLLTSLRRSQDAYGSAAPEFPKMIRDLESFLP